MMTKGRESDDKRESDSVITFIAYPGSSRTLSVEAENWLWSYRLWYLQRLGEKCRSYVLIHTIILPFHSVGYKVCTILFD